MEEYNAAMQELQPDVSPGFVSLEGYMVGKLFCMAAKAVKGDLTRENFIHTIESVGIFDLGGVVLEFGPNDHQGMDQIFLTVIKDGEIRPLEGW